MSKELSRAALWLEEEEERWGRKGWAWKARTVIPKDFDSDSEGTGDHWEYSIIQLISGSRKNNLEAVAKIWWEKMLDRCGSVEEMRMNKIMDLFWV
jgi:hypothetical protein